MKNKSEYCFLFVFLCVIFLQSVTSGQTPSPAPEDLTTKNTPEADLLHPGDLIEADVIGSTDYDWRGTLNPEGYLSGISFIENPVFGQCRSEEAVAAEIAKAYSKILRDPKVVVRILDRSNRPFSVLYGAVKTPQRFQIKRFARLSELLIISGGISDNASGEIQIYRAPNLNCLSQTGVNPDSEANSADNQEKFARASQDNSSQYINIKISDLLAGKKEANPQILSGDIVTVLEAQPIYVIGGVANPKQIAMNSKMTLTRAIASTGGIARDGDEKQISIFRRTGNQTKIITADLEKIKANQAEDVVLQPYDIIEVEQTGREKRKFPPLGNVPETDEKSSSKLPLRIID